jgi:nucleoside-diphosphate-sugar epimerase
MKILLSGGNGFTGAHFIKAANELGYDIIELKSNILDTNSLKKEIAILKPEYILHFAGISYLNNLDLNSYYKVNTLGTCNLLDSISSSGHIPKMIILPSSANIYGNTIECPINENQPPNPISHYACSKLAMEQMALTYSLSLPIIITRPFNYTGINQTDNFLIPKLINAFLAKQELIEIGNLNISREFNDVRIVCNAYLRLLQNGHPGQIYNICSGKHFSLKKIMSMLIKLTSHNPKFVESKKFIRQNEIVELYGDPKKLTECIGDLNYLELSDTLEWMLGYS